VSSCLTTLAICSQLHRGMTDGDGGDDDDNGGDVPGCVWRPHDAPHAWSFWPPVPSVFLPSHRLRAHGRYGLGGQVLASTGRPTDPTFLICSPISFALPAVGLGAQVARPSPGIKSWGVVVWASLAFLGFSYPADPVSLSAHQPLRAERSNKKRVGTGWWLYMAGGRAVVVSSRSGCARG